MSSDIYMHLLNFIVRQNHQLGRLDMWIRQEIDISLTNHVS